MERHSLGGRGTVTDRAGGSLRPERGPSRCKSGVACGASPKPSTPDLPRSQTLRPAESGARMGHPIIPDEVGTQRAPAPPQPRGRARPGAKRRGLRLRPTCLHGRGSSRRAAAGTPKPVARCVPGRAQRSKPGRADIVPPSAVAQPRREHWRGMCLERSDRTSRASAAHRSLREGWRTLPRAAALRLTRSAWPLLPMAWTIEYFSDAHSNAKSNQNSACQPSDYA